MDDLENAYAIEVFGSAVTQHLIQFLDPSLISVCVYKPGLTTTHFVQFVQLSNAFHSSLKLDHVAHRNMALPDQHHTK